MAEALARDPPGRGLRRLRLRLLLRHGPVAGARRAVCPNCGYAANSLESWPDRGGDYVLMDRAAFSIRPPRRWEIVAFRRWSQADQIVVKRVVGLPGEAIDIRRGEVYADGRLLRKNLVQQRAVAILVHDAQLSPGASRPCHAGGVPSGRTVVGVRSAEALLIWLRIVGRSIGSSIITGVNAGNRPSYNPSQPRREEDVHPVSDLMLSFRLVHGSGSGVLYVRMHDGGDDFQARLEWDRSQSRYRVFHHGRPLPGGTGSVATSPGEQLVEVSLVDRQFLLALMAKRCWHGPMSGPSRRRLRRRVPWRSVRKGCRRQSAICESTGTCITRIPLAQGGIEAAMGLCVWGRGNITCSATTAQFPRTAATGRWRGKWTLSSWWVSR